MKKFLSYFICVAMVFAFVPSIAFADDTSSSKPDAPATVKAVDKGKTSVKISWSKVKGADGYQVYISDGSKYKKEKTTKESSYTDKKLKEGKVYKYKVRAYDKVGGKTVYSSFSYAVKVQTAGKVKNVKKVTLNKSSAVIKKGETVTLKAKLTPSDKIVSRTVTWTSSDNKIATVSGGVVKAVKEGKCTITARSHNGYKAEFILRVISDLSMSEDVYNMTKKLASYEDYAFDIGYKLAYDEDLSDDKTGFRTAGSDAEHRTANWLAKEMKAIGLTSVEKVPVTVDKWQFNEAYLTLDYTDQNTGKAKKVRINDMISYASDGTVQAVNKEKYDWDNMDIVDVGMGFKSDYDGLSESVKGKIALVGVDQWNEVWIDGPYMEAANQGAAAIITYPVGGYGQKDEDANNVQDLCAPNKNIPCTGISKNNAEIIQDAIENGGDSLKAKLYVDNYVGDEDGVSYNVVGKIAGKDSNAQQIVIAAHYDKYFYGFQDDCIAVGLVYAIAKAMVESGYIPQHDIVFVAHGAEEWGEFDTSTDWAIGSWEMITEAKSDWRGRTLALLNYELPAIDHGATTGIMRTSYEMGHIGKEFLDSGLLANVEAFYSDGIKVVNDDEMTQTDVISYQFSGVPSVMPRQDNRTTWTQEHYHTQYDNVDTYSEELLEYDIACYAALAMYIDKSPALELDFTARTDELKDAVDDTTRTLAGTNLSDSYENALADLNTVSVQYLKKAEDINDRYEAAVKAGKNEEFLNEIREEGKILNEKSLRLFQYVQDNFIGLADYGDTEVFHKALQNNIELLDETIQALGDGEVTEDDIWIPAELYGWYEYYGYLFSPETCAESNNTVMNVNVKDNWGTDKMTTALPSYNTTMKMIELYNGGKTDTADYKEVISEYEGYKAQLMDEFKSYLISETKAMNQMAGMMK